MSTGAGFLPSNWCRKFLPSTILQLLYSLRPTVAISFMALFSALPSISLVR